MEWNDLNTSRYYDYINSIIKTRGQWNINDGDYKECHHIIPKSYGGPGKAGQKHENIIWLYAKEHYQAHKILAEDNPTENNVVYAFWLMNNMNNKNQKREIGSAEEYELSRKLFIQSEKNKKTKYKKIIRVCPFCNTEFQTKENLSKAYCSKECAQKAQVGRKASLETKQKISQRMMGDKNPNYGKRMSDEMKQYLRNINLGKGNPLLTKKCKYCGKEFQVNYSKRNQIYCGQSCRMNDSANIAVASSTSVICLDVNGNIVGKYISISEAARWCIENKLTNNKLRATRDNLSKYLDSDKLLFGFY